MNIVNPKFGNEENSKDYVVFSLDGEEMNDLGKVIGTKYSRDFLKITQTETLNLKEIAKRVEQNENPRLPNPTHHKNRLEKLGLVVGTFKTQRNKGHILRYFKGKKIIIIVPNELVNSTQENNELQHAISNICK